MYKCIAVYSFDHQIIWDVNEEFWVIMTGPTHFSARETRSCNIWYFKLFWINPSQQHRRVKYTVVDIVV